jgi:integrase
MAIPDPVGAASDPGAPESPLPGAGPFIAVQDHRRAFKGALDRAGLGGLRFRFHDLRHTFATWLGAENPEAVVAALLGHTPTTVTSLYTQHVGPERLRRALDGLPELG